MMRWCCGSVSFCLSGIGLCLLVTLAAALPGKAQSPSCPTPSADETSLRALLQHAGDLLRAQDADQQNFTWQERESRQQWSGGAATHSEDETWDVSTIAGHPYKRLIARDGHPLSSQEQQEQQRKLQSFIASHEPQSAADRAEIARKQQKQRDLEQRRQAALLHDFHFTLSGSRSTPWGKAWVIHATPASGVHLADREERMMAHFAGDLWIDAGGCHLMRLDLTVLDPITFGWVLGRIEPGSHLLLNFAPVESGDWFLRQFSLQAQGRILFKHLDLRLRTDYFDYRRFQVETRILPAVPVAGP